MQRHGYCLVLGIICIFFCLTTIANAEIVILPIDKGFSLKSMGQETAISAQYASASLTEDNGAKAEVKYDAAGDKIGISATAGDVNLVLGIANIALPQGQSGVFYIDRQSGAINIESSESNTEEVNVVFPDGSRVILGSGAAIKLTPLADGTYNCCVTGGEVTFVDNLGNSIKLSGTGPDNACKIVKGFQDVPGWRTAEPKRRPMSPP